MSRLSFCCVVIFLISRLKFSVFCWRQLFSSTQKTKLFWKDELCTLRKCCLQHFSVLQVSEAVFLWIVGIAEDLFADLFFIFMFFSFTNSHFLFFSQSERMPDADALKMFIGQIPKDWTETECRQLLEPYGPIYALNILKDKDSKKSKGTVVIFFFLAVFLLMCAFMQKTYTFFATSSCQRHMCQPHFCDLHHMSPAKLLFLWWWFLIRSPDSFCCFSFCFPFLCSVGKEHNLLLIPIFATLLEKLLDREWIFSARLNWAELCLSCSWFDYSKRYYRLMSILCQFMFIFCPLIGWPCTLTTTKCETMNSRFRSPPTKRKKQTN